MIVSDSFGRAWRQGTTDVAIGLAGIRPLLDLKGTRDRAGYELHATVIAVADELAGAAELVLGKTDGVPAAVISGSTRAARARARELVMPAGARPLPLAAPAQRDPVQDLAHDPVGHERGDVGRADGRRDHLDDLGADELEPPRDLAAGPEQVAARHPAGLGRAGPGAKAGSSTSTSTVR